MFKSRIRIDFPYASKYLIANKSTEINLTDAESFLKTYSNSKLKQKDDLLFQRGKDMAIMGIRFLIFDLKDKKME